MLTLIHTIDVWDGVFADFSGVNFVRSANCLQTELTAEASFHVQ